MVAHSIGGLTVRMMAMTIAGNGDDGIMYTAADFHECCLLVIVWKWEKSETYMRAMVY